MELAAGAQEAPRLAQHRGGGGKHDEGIDRHEDGELAVPAHPDESVLDGDGEIGECQQGAVGHADRDDGVELPKGEEAHRREQQDGRPAAQQQRGADQPQDPPPGACAHDEFGAGCRAAAVRQGGDGTAAGHLGAPDRAEREAEGRHQHLSHRAALRPDG